MGEVEANGKKVGKFIAKRRHNMDEKIDASTLPVMKAHCQSCPFKPNKKGHWQCPEVANGVIKKTLFQAQQICHSTEGPNRKARNRCKGAFDYNSEIYTKMGFKEFIK